MNARYIFPFAISAIIWSSCATQQVATQTDVHDDDVYYSKAKAVDRPVYVARTSESDEFRSGTMNYDDAYDYNDSYANRIDRFYSYSPWRNYYDPFWSGSYAFSPWYSNTLGFNNPGFGFGLGLGLGFGSPWAYANPYSFWGPNSFYNYWGGGYNAWGGGYYGLGGFPGYYGGGIGVANNGNYRARPVRSGDGSGYINTGRGVGAARTGYTRDSQGNINPIYRSGRTRGGYNDGSGSIDRNATAPRSRPSRPERTYDAPPRQQQQPRIERSYPSSPPPSSGGGNSGGGGGGGRTRGGRG